MNRKTLDEQIKLLEKRIAQSYDIIKEYEKLKKLLEKKGLLDQEFLNIIYKKIETCEENIIKDEELRTNYIYEVMK
jgi:uncharacterized protein YjgD (DUF1641 family)